MPSRQSRELDIAALEAAYRQRVEAFDPDASGIALRLLDRLPPDQWRLEWSLPWWLGKSFGVPDEAIRDLCVANLLGLGSVRLTDDALDGELAGMDPDAAAELAATLHEACEGIYRSRFDAGSPIWAVLEGQLRTWREAATMATSVLPAAFDLDDDQAVLALSARGAPLKICAAAVALLAGRNDAIPALDDCLDRALSALVLYDDFADWEADLGAGRWNAFVGAVEPRARSRIGISDTRTAVLLALLEGRERKYTKRIVDQARTAAALAQALDCTPLARHMGSFARRARREAAEVRRHYRRHTVRATELLFGFAS